MDFEQIRQAAEGYQKDMTRFLRDMIAIPSESCEEEGVARRIAEELKKLGAEMEFFPYTDTVSSTRIREELARLKEAALNERKDRKTADN